LKRLPVLIPCIRQVTIAADGSISLAMAPIILDFTQPVCGLLFVEQFLFDRIG
jgi:hypothetical protein